MRAHSWGVSAGWPPRLFRRGCAGCAPGAAARAGGVRCVQGARARVRRGGDLEAYDEECLEFDPYAFIKSLPPLADVVPPARPAPLLPRQTRRCPRKTLVLDLDETLVHSTLDACDAPDFAFSVAFAGRSHTVHVRRRPHLAAFLEAAAALFEVVVFTASQKVYAEQLINVLDPGRRAPRPGHTRRARRRGRLAARPGGMPAWDARAQMQRGVSALDYGQARVRRECRRACRAEAGSRRALELPRRGGRGWAARAGG